MLDFVSSLAEPGEVVGSFRIRPPEEQIDRPLPRQRCVNQEEVMKTVAIKVSRISEGMGYSR
jgi:hypothetical protein